MKQVVLNDVFTAAYEQARQKPVQLPHNQQVRSDVLLDDLLGSVGGSAFGFHVSIFQQQTNLFRRNVESL